MALRRFPQSSQAFLFLNAYAPIQWISSLFTVAKNRIATENPLKKFKKPAKKLGSL
jgi:hypothetical protein